MGKNNNNIKSHNFLKQVSKDVILPKTNLNTEVRLVRVKFKPGYNRVWRESRLALKELIGLKFIYQKQLTRYLTRFYRKSNSPIFIINDLNLSKIVIYSKVLPDYNTFTLFFNSNLIFINGYLPHQPNIICVVNDIIQLIVLKWYYIFYRWLLHFYLVRVNKLKKLIYRKGLSSRYKVMKVRKQKSQNIPD